MARATRMNSITSPELLTQVNQKNTDLLKDFVEYLQSTQKSDGTIKGYKNDIQIAFVWSLLYNDNAFFCDWNKRQLIKFQNWLLNDNGNSPARVRRIRGSLSSMGNYVESVLDDEFPKYRNIINKIEAPVNQQVRTKTILTDEDVRLMLDTLLQKKKYEMACYVALAAFGGRRKSEICRFKVTDFADSRLVCGGSLWKSDPIKTKGRGRGKYLHCYTLVSKFRPFLERWLRERIINGIESEWLFPKHNNPSEHIDITTVNSWMTTLSKLTGADIYAHSFRHYYTTMLSNQGLPDSVIKEVQGWADIGMVSVYVDRSTEETLEMYFDSDGIKTQKQKSLSDLE